MCKEISFCRKFKKKKYFALTPITKSPPPHFRTVPLRQMFFMHKESKISLKPAIMIQNLIPTNVFTAASVQETYANADTLSSMSSETQIYSVLNMAWPIMDRITYLEVPYFILDVWKQTIVVHKDLGLHSFKDVQLFLMALI